MTEILKTIDTIPDQTIFKFLKEKQKWTHFCFDNKKFAKHIITLLDSNQIDGDGLCVLINSSILNNVIKQLFPMHLLLQENIEVNAYILKIGELWGKDDHLKEFILYVEYLNSR